MNSHIASSLSGHSRLRTPFGLVLGALAVIYAFGMFNHGLIPSMEPRFAEVIREMLATHQYLVPIKNGIPYVEYPPFLYWLGLLGVKLGLPIAAAIRLPCYLALLAWVWSMRSLQTVVWPDWPEFTMPLLGAALPAVLWHFFTAQTDALLTLGALISLVGFAELRASPEARIFPLKLWLGIALATAAKGPVGIACTLPVMGLEILFAAWVRPRGDAGTSRFRFVLHEVWRLAPVRGMALLVLLIMPWYVITGLSRGWTFIYAVVIYQNFDRFLTGFDHHQPWWYYFSRVLATAFPLSLLIPVGLWAAWRGRDRFANRLALTWALFTFVFFSVSASKQGKYILPAAPAFLALGVIGVDFCVQPRQFLRVMRWMKTWTAGVIALWGVLVVLVLPFQNDRIAHVDGYRVIQEAVASAPGRLVHFGWPRSLTLYYLGAPMDYVRSSRALYRRIHEGEIRPGDYLLVIDRDLPDAAGEAGPASLWPKPAPPWFEEVLHVRAEDHMTLFRVLPGVESLPLPATPEPPVLIERDLRYDTD